MAADVAKLKADLAETVALLDDYEKTRNRRSLADAAEHLRIGATTLKAVRSSAPPDQQAAISEITAGFRVAIDRAKSYKAQAEAAKAAAQATAASSSERLVDRPVASASPAEPPPKAQAPAEKPSERQAPAAASQPKARSPPPPPPAVSAVAAAAEAAVRAKNSPPPVEKERKEKGLREREAAAAQAQREQRRKEIEQTIASDSAAMRASQMEIDVARRKGEERAAAAAESRMVVAGDDDDAADSDLSLPANRAGKQMGKDIWALILGQRDEKRKQDVGDVQQIDEFTTIFVGGKSAGKSTLISGFLDKQGAHEASTALEYSFGRRAKVSSISKDVVHCWEIAGGTRLSSLLEVCLTPEHIHSTTIALVVDLSDPGRLMEVLLNWTEAIKQRADYCLKTLEKVNPSRLEVVKKSSATDYKADHPDKDRLRPFGVPAILIGTKYDLYQDLEAEQRKVIARTLRFFAHTYGMALITIIAKDEGKHMTKFRAFMNHYMFSSPLSDVVKTSPNEALTIPRGRDTFAAIGEPGMGSASVSGSSVNAWHDMFNRIFKPKEPEEQEHLSVDETEKFKEPLVDAVIAEKEQEFARYKRLRTEVEAASS